MTANSAKQARNNSERSNKILPDCQTHKKFHDTLDLWRPLLKSLIAATAFVEILCYGFPVKDFSARKISVMKISVMKFSVMKFSVMKFSQS